MNNIKMFNKAVVIIMVVMIAFSLLAGCGSSKTDSQPQASTSAPAKESAPAQDTAKDASKDQKPAGDKPAAEGKIALGFSFGQSVHPFFIAMEKGARDAAQKNNVDIFVTSADYKVENQVANVEDLLQRNVKAILINPVDSKALATAANEANAKNVPMFTVDIAINGAPTAAHIASDNKEIGRMAARYIAKKLNGKGNIGFIGLQTVSSTLDREKGFMEEIAKTPGVKVVANQGNGMQREKALESAENILQAHPDIDAIFGVNDASAMGALAAVQARGLKNIFIVGVDSTPDMLNSIKNKTAITCTIAQDPYKMEEIAVETALKKIKGETIETNIPVQTDEVTIDNVNKFITRDSQYEKK